MSERSREGERDRICLPFLVVPMAERGLTPMSSQRREAHSRRSMRLTPASERTVWRRYLEGGGDRPIG